MKTIVISLDFELGWGGVEEGFWKKREVAGVYRRLREDFYNLLADADRLEIPMTFAVVGAMIDSLNDSSFEHLPDGYRCSVRDFVSKAEDTTVFGRDLFDMILAANVSHEVASHTYSHLHAHHCDAVDQIILADLKKSLDVIGRYVDRPKSLVFPRDQKFSGSVLEESGLSVVRVPPKAESKSTLGRLLEVPPSTARAAGWGGGESSGSVLLNWSTGSKAILKRRLVECKVRRGMLSDQDQHYWFHPFNLSEVKGFSVWFREVMEDIARMRDAGELRVCRMVDQVNYPAK